MQTIDIPADRDLAAMSKRQLDQLASDVAREHGELGTERLSDALLRINQACRSGAHSEIADNRRNRRWRRGTDSLEAWCEDAGFEIQAPCPEVTRLIGKALRAATTQQQAYAYTLHEIGLSQAHIAQVVGVTPSAVSGLLSRARTRIYNHIDEHSAAFHIFVDYYRVRRHHRLPNRPPLPRKLADARMILEVQTNVETRILPEDPRRVVIVHADQSEESVSFREVILRARKVLSN